MSACFVELHYTEKFCFEQWKTAKETLDMVKRAYVDTVMSYSRDFEWHTLFREGKNYKNMTEIKQLLEPGRRLSMKCSEELSPS